MKKTFFYLNVTLLLMVSSSVNAMSRVTRIMSLLKTQAHLSDVQSLYLSKGKGAFLKDLSNGVVPAHEVQNVARLFTRKSLIQPEHYIQLFSEKIENMEVIRNAVSAKADYTKVATALNEEIVQDSFDFAQQAVDIDPSVVRAVVDRVPSVLRKQGIYWHGFTTREGTLLDYVEDEITESSDVERLANLDIIKRDLVERGAKRLRELHAEALS